MKYYSDLTKKFYEKASECEKAEAAFKAEQKKKEEEALQKSNARKEAAKKVEEAYNKLIAAKKEYESILSNFCKEYGTYQLLLVRIVSLIGLMPFGVDSFSNLKGESSHFLIVRAFFFYF